MRPWNYPAGARAITMRGNDPRRREEQEGRHCCLIKKRRALLNSVL